MRGTRGLLQNLSFLTLGQATSQLLNVWALVFLADYLGAHWFGVVQVGVAFMGYALVTAEWGMFALGIREISRLDASQDILTYARRHTGILTLQALAALGLGLLILPRLPFYANDPWVYLFYLAMVLPQIFLHTWVAMGIERMTWVGLTRSLNSFVYAVLVLVLLKTLTGWAGIPAQRWVPLLFMTAMICSNLVLALALRRWFGRFVLPAAVPAAELRRRWLEALPIGASNFVLRILLNVDLIVLGLLAAPAVAGVYAAASRVIFLLIVAIEVLWAALLPRLSRLAARDPEAFRRSFNLYLGFVLAGLLPVAVGGRLVGPDLINLLYGEEFAGAGPVFQNLSIAYAMLAVAMYLGNSLVAADRQRDYFRPLALGAALAVAATVLLARAADAVGISRGMLIAHSLLAFLLILSTRRLLRRGVGWLLAMLAPSVGLMALAVLWAGQWPVLARIGLGGAVYLALVPWPLLWFHRAMRANPEVVE